MPHTHTITHAIRWTDGKNIYTQDVSDTQTGSSYAYVKETIPDASTDLQVTFELDKADMKMLLIKADGPLTIETNSGVSPDDTFNVTASKWIYWSAAGQPANNDEANPIGVANITTDIYVTNTSGKAVTLEILSLTDATP